VPLIDLEFQIGFAACSTELQIGGTTDGISMDLHLYDTMTRSKDRPFEPIDPANVRMYVCGPTVYDFAHIGNARPVIVFDVLFRLLRHRYGEDHVTYVRNITDVDDKINDRAARDFPGLPLNQAIRRVTEATESQFQADAKALGCLTPTFQPRATDFVLPRSDGRADMKSLIQKLLDRQNAYVAIGSEGREVLFDVSSMPDYGALSKRRLDQQMPGARIAVDSHKRNAEDFVLWKESGAKEPGWKGEFRPNPKSGYEAEFTISRENASRLQLNSQVVTIHGRPGWHIECSAMAAAYLGKTFDIHGGGLDLIFPHHENEIAQSRCAHGTPFMANVWMHNGFLQVEREKMSKSLGNFVTINELLMTNKFGGRRWSGAAVRLAMLKTHYRQPIDWTVRGLEEAESVVEEWNRLAIGINNEVIENLPVLPRRPLYPPVADALHDDLNISQALAAIHRLRNSIVHNPTDASIVAFTDSLRFLGLYRDSYSLVSDVSEYKKSLIRSLIEARTAARARKDFKESDRIRDELGAMGVVLKDGKDADGQPVTTWDIAR
jgi:cysteinyl-tRNA synthetase